MNGRDGRGEDDDRASRERFDADNLGLVERLYRRVDLADAGEADRLAMLRAAAIGFDRLIVSATAPFRPEDVVELGRDAAATLARRLPGCLDELERRDWRLPGRLYS